MEKFKSGVTDKDAPRLDKEFRSTSTAELAPKVEDLKAKGSSMPPRTVMFKLISVMTFRKLIRNPNTYSSLIGLVWSLISNRCVHFYSFVKAYGNYFGSDVKGLMCTEAFLRWGFHASFWSCSDDAQFSWLIICRWNFQMPLLLHNSVHILSDAGLGMAMFSLGMRRSLAIQL